MRRGDSGGRLARKFSNLLSLNEVELFDKHDVWSFWPVCMAKLGQVIGTLKPEFATEKEMAVSQTIQVAKLMAPKTIRKMRLMRM